ncbi:MAG: hypothetical protein VKK04_07300 [Synechococcales bacterium]|nr:hypothetical protein [Synechococcales bacterium]
MRRQWRWLWGVAAAMAIAIILSAPVPQGQISRLPIWPATTQAQTPPADPPAAPSPAEAQPSATPAPEVPPAPAVNPLPLTATPYRDPANRFEIGVIEGFQVNAIGEFPIIEAPDGRLAYTVVVLPSFTDAPLSNAALAQAARDTFQQGEGFRIQGFQAQASGGLRMTWTGQLTIAGQSQPLSGVILAQQQANRIFLTLIAATDAAKGDIPGAIAALSNSLQFLLG